jgi:hypothetical protein
MWHILLALHVLHSAHLTAHSRSDAKYREEETRNKAKEADKEQR